MERTIEFSIEIDRDGNYKVVSCEPESGTDCIVDAGNLFRMNDADFRQKVGTEILSWMMLWSDELVDDE